MHAANLAAAQAFTTLDGSTIRELAGAVSLPARNQSLAQATVPPGCATTAHFHRLTEELYVVTSGRGRLRVDGEERDVAPGECVLVTPGAEHKLWNTGEEDLLLWCCCAPAYSDEDTVLTEEPDG